MSTQPSKKDDEIRLERALEGAAGLMARVGRQLERLRDERRTCALSVSIKSHDGLLTVVISESTKVGDDRRGSFDVDEMLLSVMDRLDHLAHRGVNKTLMVEIVSREGTLTANETMEEIHRWNG